MKAGFLFLLVSLAAFIYAGFLAYNDELAKMIFYIAVAFASYKIGDDIYRA